MIPQTTTAPSHHDRPAVVPATEVPVLLRNPPGKASVTEVSESNALVRKIFEIVRDTHVTLNGDLLCNQGVLFEGNLSLNGLPQEDQRAHAGRSRSFADLAQARQEFALSVARRVAAALGGH